MIINMNIIIIMIIIIDQGQE